MKKLTIVIFLTWAFTSLLSAQGNFRFGIQASPTFSWLATDQKDINGNGTNLGLKLGLTGEYDFGENYSFTAGINFAFNHGGTLKYNKGGKYWPSVTGGKDLPDKVDLKYNLQLIELPFSMKMRTNQFGFMRFYAELPILTFGFVTKSTGDIKSTANDNTEKENIKNEVKAMSISWGLGAGLEYEISSSTKLIGGLSFQSYFLDLTENTGKIGGTETDDSKASMKGLTIKIGVIF